MQGSKLLNSTSAAYQGLMVYCVWDESLIRYAEDTLLTVLGRRNNSSNFSESLVMLNKKIFSFLFFLISLINAGNSQQPEMVLPIGHTDNVNTARFSSDGKYVITGGTDKQVNIWETFSGKKIRSLGGNTSGIIYAFFSNDNKYIVVGTDSSVIIWSVPAYTQLGKFNFVKNSLFSPDSRKLFLLDYNGNVKQIALPAMLNEFEFKDNIYFDQHKFNTTYKIAVSKDNKMVATAGDSLITIREMETGKIIVQKTPDGTPITCFFSFDGLNLISVTNKGIQKIELKNGFTITSIIEESIESAFLSRNNKYLFANTDNFMDGNSILWDFEKYKILYNTDTISGTADTMIVMDTSGNYTYQVPTLNAPYKIPYSRLTFTNINIDDTGKYFWTMSYLWNNNDFSKSYRIENNHLSISDISRDGRFLLSQINENGVVNLWDIEAQKIIQSYKTQVDNIRISEISPDGTKMLIGGEGNKVSVSTINNGQTIYQLEHKERIAYATFSRDGKNILTNSYDSTAKLWDAASGKLIQTYYHQYPESNPAYFSRNGDVVLTELIYDTIPVYDPNDMDKIIRYELFPFSRFTPREFKRLFTKESKTGRYRIDTNPYGQFILNDSLHINDFHFETMPLNWFSRDDFSMAFSSDEKKLVLAIDLQDDTLLIWDIKEHTWKYITDLNVTANLYGRKEIIDIQFTSDDKFLIVADMNSVIHVLNGETFKPEYTIPGQQFSFSDNGKYLITTNDGKCDIYDFEKRQFLYSYISVDSDNYLVVDSKKRYDGTKMASKLLYYTCGNEIVDLDQAKDQLWVPNLAERIMKGETINAKTLEELDICGLTPEVEDVSIKTDEFHFNIKPRRGGLGETVLLVNGIEAKRYKPEQLKKNGGVYELIIKKTELRSLFITGKENPITVKAYTSDNALSSRGITIEEDLTKVETMPPNLYAVMVGVSDYKGEELDLKYAAKDATDISNAMSDAAKKLLNTDSKEHVFMYNLTTAKERYQLPEKNSIKKNLEEIGKKATANDILLIFFAGHGVMMGEGDKKQFYFLTADASSLSAGNSVKDVGISTTELTEWMKPDNIKAQKRILIFDACNSGQAISDFVKMGKDDQGYLAARNDDKSQQIKAIDKLNEKSGLFILSASASNQSAYEMGRYSQGLLTYSLLKAIKQQPDILEDGKYLNVSRWFNAAEKTVSEIAKESGARQQPQIVSNTNFNIGLVDDEVMAKIVLPQEKPMFAASNFQNSDEAIADDDLELSKMINLQLSDIAARGSDSKIVYITATNSPDAYSLSGRYTITGNTISITVNIKQNKTIQSKFELIGTKDKLSELVFKVTDKVVGMVK